MKKNPSVQSPNSFLLPILAGLVIVVAVWLIYRPALGNQFTNYDERAYVTENPNVQNLNAKGIQAEFSRYYMGNYHPLTMVSYQVDYALHGMKPEGYILTNIILHALACLFVYLFLLSWSGNVWAALCGGLLFAAHPIHVESVAWIAERKDVLYTAFLCMALFFGFRWIQHSGKLDYALTLLLFILACLAKGMAVVFSPVLALLLLGYTYKTNGTLSLKSLMRVDLIPFFLISLIFGWVAILAQAEAEAIRTDTGSLPFYAKLLYPAYGIWFYIQKFVWPMPLSAHYDYPKLNSLALLTAPVWIALVAGLCWMGRKKFPEWTLGLLFYLAAISIVLQILPVGKAIAADRYLYFASVGFSLALTWALNRWSNPWASWALSALFLLMGFTLTQNRIRVWKNSLSLWEDTFKENQQVPFVLFNLGVSLEKRGREDDIRAMQLYQKALSIDSSYFEPYNNLGILLNQYGQSAQAVPLYYKALQLKPGHSDTYNNLATAQQALGNYEEALKYFRKSLELDPGNPSPHNNLGTLLNELKRYEEAAWHYHQALKLKSSEPRVWYNLGNLYYQIQKTDSAAYCYEEALKIKPDYPDAMGNMGVLFFSRQDYQTAISWYEKALAVDPKFRDAWFNLGVTWYYLKDPAKSRSYFEKAASLGHPAAQQWIRSNP